LPFLPRFCWQRKRFFATISSIPQSTLQSAESLAQSSCFFWFPGNKLSLCSFLLCFYCGGLFGGFAGLWIYCRQFHLPFWTFADLYAAVLPLGHAIGRIGCHFAGCCYGIPYDGAFSVTYHSTLGNTPLETPLLPVQLIESFCLFLLFVSLSLFYHNKKLSSKKGQISGLYSLSYAMVRILLECLRGDRVRGMFLGISTSQWISFALLFLGVFLLFRKAKAQTSFS